MSAYITGIGKFLPGDPVPTAEMEDTGAPFTDLEQRVLAFATAVALDGDVDDATFGSVAEVTVDDLRR